MCRLSLRVLRKFVLRLSCYDYHWTRACIRKPAQPVLIFRVEIEPGDGWLCSTLPLVSPGSLRPFCKKARIETNLITDFERWDTVSPRHSFNRFLVEPKHVSDFFDFEGVIKSCEPARDAEHFLWRWKRFDSLSCFSRAHSDTPLNTRFVFSRTVRDRRASGTALLIPCRMAHGKTARFADRPVPQRPCRETSPGICAARSPHHSAWRDWRLPYSDRRSPISVCSLKSERPDGSSCPAWPFPSFRLASSDSGIGISRSLYAFGVQLRSGLCVTLTVQLRKVDIRPVEYMTSCSRMPVIKKNSNHRRSSGSQASGIRDVFPLVNFRLLFGESRPVVLAHQPSYALRFQKRHDVLKLVIHAARSLSFFVPERRVRT